MSHALLSPSGASRWTRCPGSVALTAHLPRTSSVYADEGTAAHTLASWCLENRLDADAYIGRIIQVEESGREFTVDNDMTANVQMYVDYVRQLADGYALLTEQRVSYASALGIPAEHGHGTSDAVILETDRLTIVDLKYGMGVKVFAEENEQLLLYAAGCLETFSMLGEWSRVRMAIVMPRLDHVDEWEIAAEELRQRVEAMKNPAEVALDDVRRYANASELTRIEPKHLRLTAGEKQCRFCGAKATCPRLREEAASTLSGHALTVSTLEDFADLTPAPYVVSDADWLGAVLDKADLIEAWLSAVREEAYNRLQRGEPVTGYKLVEGKRGARAWTDEAAAEALLAPALADKAYSKPKLISPTQAEKALKGSPSLWDAAQALIHQPPGRPAVAPDRDKRASLPSTADAFAAVPDAPPTASVWNR